MSDQLDTWLARLSADGVAAPPDLEVEVLASIAARRDDLQRSRRLMPYRAASVAVAMALGVAAGGVSAGRWAVEPRQLSTFSMQAHLAPSTLLEGRG